MAKYFPGAICKNATSPINWSWQSMNRSGGVAAKYVEAGASGTWHDEQNDTASDAIADNPCSIYVEGSSHSRGAWTKQAKIGEE